jgi:hypothetical protein
MALWALVTRCWAWVRLVPEPDPLEGLAPRAAAVVAAVATGVETAVAAEPLVPLVPLVVPVLPVAVVVVLWSDSRVALALARDALAEVSALRSGAGSRVASTWPAVTVSPTETDTPETVPAAAKLWLTWLTRWADPVRLRRCSTDPVVTVVVR